MRKFDEELLCRFGISSVPGIGARTIKQLIEQYGSISRFLEEGKEFISKYKIPKPSVLIDSAKKDLETADNFSVNVCVLGESNYPRYLATISDPPPVLFWKGRSELLNSQRIISVVGTRNMTNYGKRMIGEFVASMVDNNYVTVSGMAFGVDREVHEKTLKEKGDSIAVLASSPNTPSPRANTDIYNKLVQNGLVVSEIPPWLSEVTVGSFPRRNRIIAGMSPALLVVEAADSSGSLITANQAFGEGRLVFAIPGQIGQKHSVGTNRLIKDSKAKLVESFEDILVELGIEKVDLKTQEKYSELTELERKIVDMIIDGSNTFELIVDRIGNSESELRQLLGMLEIKGVVIKQINGNYCLT